MSHYSEFQTAITIVKVNDTSTMVNDFLVKETKNKQFIVISPSSKRTIESFNSKTSAISWTISGIQRHDYLQTRIKSLDKRLGKYLEDQYLYKTGKDKTLSKFKRNYFSDRLDYATSQLNIIQSTIHSIAKDQNLEY